METKIIIHPASIRSLVDRSWSFAYQNSWHEFRLSNREVSHLKQLIKDYYHSIPPEHFGEWSGQYFDNFSQEILRERQRGDFKILHGLLDKHGQKLALLEILANKNIVNRSLKLFNQRFDLSVLKAGQTIAKTFHLNGNIANVNGILLSSDKENLLYARGRNKIVINGDEYFPEDYESKFLMASHTTPPGQRYHKLECMGQINNNCSIDVKYEDVERAAPEFKPYTVSFHFSCETDD